MGEIHKINGHTIKDEHAHKRIDEKADKHHKHDEYLTEHQDLSTYATKEELRTHKHSDYATKKDLENFNPGNIVLEDVITKAEFNEHIAEYNRRLNNTEYLIDQKISDLVDAAPEAMDTLKELADSISENRSIYDQYIQSMTEMINGKAEKDHEHEQYALGGHTHGYSELGHMHEEYALANHDHKQYLTKHQDVSYLATNGKVNKLVTYLYDRLLVLEGIVEELGAEVPDGGDLPIDPNEPTDPENPGEEPDIPFDPDEPVVPEGDRILLEYTFIPYNSTKPFDYWKEYYLPTIYTTSDSWYVPTSDDIVLTLKDGTTTSDLNTIAGNIEKISITYDKNIYRIMFRYNNDANYPIRVKDILQINTSNLRTMSYMFSNCKYLETVNTNNFYTNKVSYMNNMFYGCDKLTSLDVSRWDTSKVKNMSYMFYGCSKLTSLDVSNWNTELNTNFTYIFYECNSLASLNVSNWNIERATSLGYMFYNCSSLKTLDLSNWNTSNITSLSYLFRGCVSLKTLDLSNWNTSNVANMSYMFCNCSSLSSVNGLANINTIKVTDMEYLFFNTGFTELNLTTWDVSNIKYFGYMFDNNLVLEKIDLSTWNLKNEGGYPYSRIFADCMSLKELNIYGFAKTNGHLDTYLSNNMLLNVNLDCVITIPNDEKIIALFDQYYPEYTYVYQD